ncbi:MAG TPA: hypothetical protein VHQ65_11215 [Thermoanaerobaculia bacterium]|nr:hypothetical protein [Thermoanaerobaculia bacterium]
MTGREPREACRDELSARGTDVAADMRGQPSAVAGEDGFAKTRRGRSAVAGTDASAAGASPSGGALATTLARPGAAPLVILVVIAALYAPLFGRWFTSEDFLLLRFLRQEPPWADWATWWTGPWLGIEVVRFYRPVSTLLLAVEANLFAGAAWAYNLVHLLVHAANAVMLWALARDLGRDRGLGGAGIGHAAIPRSGALAWPPVAGADRSELQALAAAVLFAIHPLHPNAVSWIASFATPFATAFLLAAFLAHRRFRRHASRAWQAGSLVLFALALGSYEAAIVLPVLVALAEHLLPRAGMADEKETFGRRQVHRLLAWLPLAALAAVYLLLRRAIFGQVVGGYQDFAARFDAAEAARLLGDLGEALVHLLVPVYAAPVPAWAPAALAAVLLLVPLVVLAPRRREVAGWVFGWAWAVVALAPFAFAPYVPGNGRYAYLSALGATFALGRLIAPPATAARRAAARSRGSSGSGAAAGFGGGARGVLRHAVVGGVLLLALGWGWLLVANGRIYREAGETARRVSAALAATPEAARGGTVFVAGYPVFLENALGVPLAQVFHYGLADSVLPPFRDTALVVYPLPRRNEGRNGADWWPIAAAHPDAGLYAWDATAERLRRIAPPAAVPEPLDARLMPGGEVLYRPFASAGPVHHRLLLTARGNPTALDLPPAPPGAAARYPLPAAFLATMVRLYGIEIWWWLEARDSAGRLVAATPLRRARKVRSDLHKD